MALEVVGVVASSEGRDLEVRGCGSDVIWIRVEGGEELYGSGSLKGLARMALLMSL